MRMKVMIVDDNASMRGMIRAMLDSVADSFCECSDGSEAADLYAHCHPDWVLMDIKMKEVDGFEATGRILSKFPDAKIIMITQFDEPRMEEKARSAGAVEFVLKDRLLDIERIIDRTHN
jgi:CheY-like chemotaxis protein